MFSQDKDEIRTFSGTVPTSPSRVPDPGPPSHSFSIPSLSSLCPAQELPTLPSSASFLLSPSPSSNPPFPEPSFPSPRTGRARDRDDRPGRMRGRRHTVFEPRHRGRSGTVELGSPWHASSFRTGRLRGHGPLLFLLSPSSSVPSLSGVGQEKGSAADLGPRTWRPPSLPGNGRRRRRRHRRSTVFRVRVYVLFSVTPTPPRHPFPGHRPFPGWGE